MVVNECTTCLFSPSDFVAIFIYFVLFLAIWEGVWKAIALWRAGRNNQLKWFVVIAIFNTIGILPIIYLRYFQKKQTK